MITGIITGLLAWLVYSLARKAYKSKKVIPWIGVIVSVVLFFVWQMGFRPYLNNVAIQHSLMEQEAEKVFEEKTKDFMEPTLLLEDKKLFLSKNYLTTTIKQRKQLLNKLEKKNIEELIEDIETTILYKCLEQHSVNRCRFFVTDGFRSSDEERFRKALKLKTLVLKEELDLVEFIAKNYASFNKQNFSFKNEILQQKLSEKVQRLSTVSKQLESI